MSKKKIVFNAYDLLNSPEMSAYLDQVEAEESERQKRRDAEMAARQRQSGSKPGHYVSDDELSADAVKRDNISQTTDDISGRANDVWQALKSGAAQLIQGAGWLANEAGAHDSGQFLRDIGQIGKDQALANMTPAGREAQKNGVFKEDLSGVNNDWGRGMAQGIAGSAVPSIVGALLGAPVARGIGAAGDALLGRAAVSEGALGSVLDAAIKYTPAPVMRLAGALPGAAGAGAGEAAVTGATNGAQAYQEVMDAPIESLRKSTVFQSLSKELGSEDAARKAIADRMSIQTAKDTALSTGLIGAAMGGGAVGSLLNKFAVKQGAKEVGRLGAKAAAKEVLKDGTKEFAEEFAQSGPEHYLQNAAKRDYLDPTIDPSTGMLRASLEGGVVGMGQGMGMSGGAHAVNRLLARNEPQPSQPANTPQQQPNTQPSSTPKSVAGYDPIAPNQQSLLQRLGVEPDPAADEAAASVASILGAGDPTAGLVASVMRGDAMQPIHDMAAVRANTVLPVGSNEGGLYEPQWLPDAASGESSNGMRMPRRGFDSQEQLLANAGMDAQDMQRKADIASQIDAAWAQQQNPVQKARELESLAQESAVPVAIDRAEQSNQINQALANAAGDGVAVPNAMQLALQRAKAGGEAKLDGVVDVTPPASVESKAPNISKEAPNTSDQAPNISSEPALTMQQNERGQWIIKGDMAQHAQTIREALPGTKLVVSQKSGQALVQMPADKNTGKQGKAIRKALDHLLLSGEQLAARDQQRANASERAKATIKQAQQLDYERDDIVNAVAKLGGIDTEQALSEWWRGQRETVGHYNAEVPGNLRRQGVFAFKRGGMTIDDMVRHLEGEGYLPHNATPNDLLDALENRSKHPAGYEADARREFDARQQEEQANAPGEFQRAYDEGGFADEFSASELEDDGLFDLNRQQREAAEAAAEVAAIAKYEQENAEWDALLSRPGKTYEGMSTEEILNEVFGPETITRQDSQGESAAGQADAGRTQAGAESSGENGRQGGAEAQGSRDEFSLSSHTESDLRREEQAAEQQQREVERQRAAADKARQDEETRKEIRRRSEAAADTFTLGGNAEDNLTGQGGLFDAPAEAIHKPINMVSKSDGSGFATRDALRAAATRDGIPQSSLIEKRDEAGNWIGLRHEPDNAIDRIITDQSRAGKVIGTSVRDLHSDDVYTLLMAASSKKQINAIADYIGKYAPRAAADAVKSHIDSALKQKGWATEEALYGGGMFDAPAQTATDEMAALKAEMGDAIGELASILGARKNLTPEEESKIIPVMSKIFRIAAKMGYVKFKDAARHVMSQIRELAGNEIADKLSIDNLQAGYINIASEIGGDKREALAYESIRELEGKSQQSANESQSDNSESATDTAAPSLVEKFAGEIANGNMPKDNNALRKMVAVMDGKQPDAFRMKQAQEDLEAAIVVAARSKVAEGGSTRDTFNRLVDLYQSQPNLNIRTSTSIANQAYSTPAPLAYVAAKLADITSSTHVFEPTAGNGMLLLTAAPHNATANELDDQRFTNLQAQGFDAMQGNALDAVTSGAVVEKSQDAVITNPPFGSVKDDAGKATKINVDGYKIGKIDHLIAADALRTMKDGGKAVLIIGADKVAGGLSTDDRIFFNWLYSHYNVTHHFEVDGSLYSRQGASWPVRVIALNGRVESNGISPKAGTVERVSTWEQVYGQLEQGLVSQDRRIDRNAASGADGSVPGSTAANEQVNSPVVIGGKAQPRNNGGRARSTAGAADVGGRGAGTGGNTGQLPAEGMGAADSAQRRNESATGQAGLESGNPERVQASATAGSDQPSGNSGANRVTTLADAENAYQARYVPASSRKDEGVLIPVNMAQPLSDALASMEDETGDIDQFAAKELGYRSVGELHQSLMGLQVDSVATAIRNLKNGNGTIIADQTGIGKGRQAAAIIRWAVKNGRIPVFVTVKPALFTDMYNDLADIGSHDIAPFILNVDESISGASGNKLFANKKATHKQNLNAIASSGTLPDGSNAVFMTYSQINTANIQRSAIATIAPRAIFVLDESHNAGGESATGEYIKGLLDTAPGVVYLSATYAKRPDNMPLYFRTDIGKAIADDSALKDAMANGGLPLQTVVSNNLVKAGQMFRRERSYDGISISTVVDSANKERHVELADKVTSALRAIVSADKAFHENYFEAVKKALEKEGKDAYDNAGNQAGKSVDHSEFSSVVHNFVRQLLLGLKADAAADHAIAALKRGEKPLIALENTMGSFLSEYAAGAGIQVGKPLGDFDYRTVLSRALKRSRYIQVDDGKGNKSKQYIGLEKLDPVTRLEYDNAQEVIDSLDVADIPVSPLDWIRYRLQKAGYSVAEITGRDLAVDYSKATPVLANVPSEEQSDKVLTTRRFNSGKLDAIILNVSGSTGISLHASEKFSDKRPRHMIVAQPAQDINIFMQMLGRIHRTGQVVLPNYTILNVDLPAEKRPTALLSKKMKSLNANTSSNTESATSVQSVDILNKYGDQVVSDYLQENIDLAQAMNIEVSADAAEDIARKVTGRLALMPVETQHRFYSEVEEQYQSLIDYLNKTNQNDLEPRTFDFDAKETRRETLVKASGESPFEQAADYIEFSIKAQGKAMTPDEIKAEISDNLQGKQPSEHAADMVASLNEKYQAFVAEQQSDSAREKAAGAKMAGERFILQHPIGSTWRVEINDDHYNAVIINIKNSHKSAGNPFSLSKTTVTIAVNGSLRQVSVPATQFEKITTSQIYSYGPYQASVDRYFSSRVADERETAKMITGNLLAAYGELSGVHGTIVNFSRADGSVDQGILLPKRFDFKQNTSGDYRFKSGSDAYKFLRESNSKGVDKIGVQNREQTVRVTLDSNGIAISVPKSKAKGGKYFGDTALTKITGDFVSAGGMMNAYVDKQNAEAAIDTLIKKTALYAIPSMAEEARKIVGDEMPEPTASIESTGNKLNSKAIDPYTFKKDGGYFIRERYLSDGKMERREPSLNGGAIDSNEPKADYTDYYETDLFGNPLPNAGRKTRATKPAPSGVRRNVHAASALPGDTAAPDGEYRVRTIVGSESQRTLGARRIASLDDLAAATSYLYRSAVERFDAIVTDASGKPLAVIGAFKGALDQASVYPATLVGEAVRIPGAAHIWFSHNHPSGTAKLSNADQNLYHRLADIFDGSGIKPMGLIAVANRQYASMEDGYLPIPQSSESMSVPVVERELSATDIDMPAITSPQVAKELAGAMYKGSEYQPGMMLLNTQNQVAAWVPLPATAMGALRHSGGLNAIYRAISESNAGAVILVHGGELSERIGSVTLGQNIAAAVAKLDVRPLDIIDIRKPRSAAETGEQIQSGPVYSKTNDYTNTQGMPAKDLQAIIAKALPAHLRERVKVAQSRSNNAQQSARSKDNGLIDEAEYDPATGQLTLYADAIPTPERALFVLSHELTHYGLDAKYGLGLSSILLEARNNPMIAKLAAAIAVDRGMTVNSVRQDIADARGVPVARVARSAAVHRLQVETANEALAELNAAIERNDFAYLQDRYGVAVPKMMRNDLRGRLSRLAASVKAWMAKLTGKQATDYSDKQVWDLLAGVRETVRGGGKLSAGYSDGAAQYSMAASSKTINVDGVTRPTTNSNGQPIAQTEEGLRNFWRWFGGSKVVDKDGKPLVVYHGTESDFDSFDQNKVKTTKLGSGFYFAKDPETANLYAGFSGSNVVPVYLRMERPLIASSVEEARQILEDNGQYMNIDEFSGTHAADMAAVLAKAGFDGIMYDGVMVVQDPTQIKSAIGNRGTFNGSDPNILRSTAPKQPASAGFVLPEETTAQQAQREVQDNMNRWKQVLENVREQGGQVDEQNDVYGAEERFHGRTATRIEDFARDEVEPLMERLAKSGHTLQDVEQFLLAQHAEEANARIREIDDSRDTAFGMEDGEAQSILAKFAAMPDAVEFKRLANDFRRISEGTLSLYVKAGIVAPEAAHAMRLAYQFYVPVKGGDEDQAARQGTGKGLSVNGKQKRRMGHDMRDEHVLENMLRDRQRAIVLAEKNNVGTYLLDLIERNPDPKLWTVNVLPKQKVLRDQVSYVVELNGQMLDAFNSLEAARVFIQAEAARTGSKPGAFAVSKSSDPYVTMMAKPTLQDHEVQVYVQGRAVRIQLHDPILAGQYRRMGTEQMGRIIEAGKSLNRWLSKVYTGYNPEFFVKNVVRDLFAGTINLTADQGGKVAAKALSHWPKAGAAMFRFALTGKAPAGEYGKALQRYRAAGGSTGAAYMGDLERQADTLTELYENYTGAMAAMQEGKPVKAAKIATRKLLGGLAHWFEVWNQAGENAFRLATFMAMEDAGKTVAQSASMAKNVTVNFNRKGELTPQLGGLYLFFNPGVQGTARLWQSMFGKDTKHKKLAWALVGAAAGAAFALALMNRWIDEDEWEAIPDSVKDRNLIIFLGGKRHITIPMPYGFSFFVSMANRLDSVMHGESAEKASIRLASSLFENFSPVGNPIGDDPKLENTLLLLPTALKILALPAANMTDFGGPMRPEYREDQPDNEKMWRGTRGSLYDKAAQGLSSLAGSPYEDNFWNDVSPETIKYLVRTLTGGTGSFMADSASLLNVLASGSAPDVSEVPLVRSGMRESTVKDARARFHELGNEAKEHVAAWKRAVDAGDDKAATEYEQDGELMAMGEMMEGYRKQAKSLRDLMALEMQRDDLTLAEKRMKQKAYENQEAEVYREYIRQFKH